MNFFRSTIIAKRFKLYVVATSCNYVSEQVFENFSRQKLGEKAPWRAREKILLK